MYVCVTAAAAHVIDSTVKARNEVKSSAIKKVAVVRRQLVFAPHEFIELADAQATKAADDAAAREAEKHAKKDRKRKRDDEQAAAAAEKLAYRDEKRCRACESVWRGGKQWLACDRCAKFYLCPKHKETDYGEKIEHDKSCGKPQREKRQKK